jgi:hypothetical protein
MIFRKTNCTEMHCVDIAVLQYNIEQNNFLLTIFEKVAN